MRVLSPQTLLATALVGSSQLVSALQLDVSKPDSIRSAASTIAKGLMSKYDTKLTGTDVGIFPGNCNGAIWGGIIDYSVVTGDKAYLKTAMDAMNAQAGPNFDYVMPTQVHTEANDDQLFWLFNLMTALEYKLPPLPCPKGTSNDGGKTCPNDWLKMADNAFNLLVSRYQKDSSVCGGGGLRWQYLESMNGYKYKNSISNGGFFMLSARLARYTGNATYADWATRVYDWENKIGFMSPDFHVFDGAGTDQDCKQVNRNEWSYNMAVWLHGAAAMADLKGGDWNDRTQGLFETASHKFFTPWANSTGIMFEPLCEPAAVCNLDQQSFKAYMARTMAKAAALVPALAPNVTALMEASAKGAASACSGPQDSNCGAKWYTNGFDGRIGVGQQLAALETIQALLVPGGPKPAKA